MVGEEDEDEDEECCPLDRLPDELLLCIVRYLLSPVDILALAGASKRLNAVCSERALWWAVCVRHRCNRRIHPGVAARGDFRTWFCAMAGAPRVRVGRLEREPHASSNSISSIGHPGGRGPSCVRILPPYTSTDIMMVLAERLNLPPHKIVAWVFRPVPLAGGQGALCDGGKEEEEDVISPATKNAAHAFCNERMPKGTVCERERLHGANLLVVAKERPALTAGDMGIDERSFLVCGLASFPKERKADGIIPTTLKRKRAVADDSEGAEEKRRHSIAYRLRKLRKMSARARARAIAGLNGPP